jgi:hypothetical protein
LSPSTLEGRAWALLQEARMEFDGRFVGVHASCDRGSPPLNYSQCFVRDFAVCAAAFVLRGEYDIVLEFLTVTLELQSRGPGLETEEPRRGLMPASFRPAERDGEPVMEGDYGEESIARVTPIDSVFWWLITLRAYTRASGDRSLAQRHEFQEGIQRTLRLALEGSFELFPTLLVPDGSFMIDRRMGVYGHPLEVQTLLYLALRAGSELLDPDDDLFEIAGRRRKDLEDHVRRQYWLTPERVDSLRTLERDEYGEEILNVFNVFPESIPEWLDTWLPQDAGYLAGNVGPGRIDFRFFAQGNLLAIAGGLCDRQQSESILRLYEARWDDLVGAAPLRIVYPALEGEAWKVVTGADTKNRPWRNHNGGWWPALLWSFASATTARGRLDLLERALEASEKRLNEDGWPEYYDGRTRPAVGTRARTRQSWTLGAYLYARACLDDPAAAELYTFSEEAGRHHHRSVTT